MSDTPAWPSRAMYDEDNHVVYGVSGEEQAEMAVAAAVELAERIEKAKAALSYFGPQGDNIIAILEGRV